MVGKILDIDQKKLIVIVKRNQDEQTNWNYVDVGASHLYISFPHYKIIYITQKKK